MAEFLPFLNKAPVIISEPIVTATEDNLYSYQVEGIDPEGDTLAYFLTLKPEGMNIKSENGLITWMPTNNQVGIHQVIVEISDGKYSVQQNFKIEVANVNDPPQILSYLPTNLSIEINEGDSIKFEVQAEDVDLNTILNYKWYLDGKIVSNSTGAGTSTDSMSSWQYFFKYEDYGLKIIKVLVNDGELEDSVQWKVTVKDITPLGKPTLNNVISPTNISPQVLSGTKEANTSIWINGLKAIPIDTYTEWSYSFELIEGENNISIVSRDSAGNESSLATAVIEYDLNIYVDAGNISGTEDGTRTYPFNTVSEGLKAAVEGKSVVVSGGTYNEQLVINKGITLQGAGKENTFITGTGFNGNLITCEADNITISGFTIDGGNSTSVGIYLDGYSSININNSLIKNSSDYGISYGNSAPTIEDNNIEINAYSGIEVGSGGSGIIRNNSITSNQYGIRTCGDSSPEITHNNISNNSHTGIYCRESSTPVISNNTISDNGYGILIDNVLGDSVNPDIGGGEGGSVGKNNITGNQTHGVSNKTSHNIIAKNNWWGDNAGPKYPGNPNNATITSDWAYWSKTGGDIIFVPYSTEPQSL
ncbi:MAG: right-handed parallel beta-helix repeat-containing protein [Candidatus Atribacteria bacterium]